MIVVVSARPLTPPEELKALDHVTVLSAETGRVFDAPEAISEVRYRGESELQMEIDRSKRQAERTKANVSESHHD